MMPLFCVCLSVITPAKTYFHNARCAIMPFSLIQPATDNIITFVLCTSQHKCLMVVYICMLLGLPKKVSCEKMSKVGLEGKYVIWNLKIQIRMFN